MVEDFEFSALKFVKSSRMTKRWLVFSCKIENDLIYVLYTLPTVVISRRTDQYEKAYETLRGHPPTLLKKPRLQKNPDQSGKESPGPQDNARDQLGVGPPRSAGSQHSGVPAHSGVLGGAPPHAVGPGLPQHPTAASLVGVPHNPGVPPGGGLPPQPGIPHLHPGLAPLGGVSQHPGVPQPGGLPHPAVPHTSNTETGGASWAPQFYVAAGIAPPMSMEDMEAYLTRQRMPPVPMTWSMQPQPDWQGYRN
eukprot:jgi/Botrbrau1/8399/Bobra.0237s0020.1